MSVPIRPGDSNALGLTGAPPPPAGDAGPPWQRLARRMIWVDAVQSLLALIPFGLALVFGSGGGPGDVSFALVAIAVLGVTNAVQDAVRWGFTRYRVTDDYVERRSGVFVRSYRSMQRDRIRTVDIEAKLRHKLAGLRLVKIGAGQQAAAGEAALDLDAVLIEDAEALRALLLGQTRVPDPSDPATPPGGSGGGEPEHGPGVESAATGRTQVLARFRPGWVVYNVFSVWAYVVAIGLIWGAYWLGTVVGADLGGFVGNMVDWESLGWGWTLLIGFAVVGIVGVIGLGVNYFTEYWDFELTRIPGEHGVVLRTRRGLFRTREVNRDVDRIRGVQIAEPVLWRWMGAADTTVITTGLDQRAMSQPSAILPRGPVGVARPVAATVLGVEPSPLEAPLRPHPPNALRRRFTWATAFTAVVLAVLGWLAVTHVVAWWVVIVGIGLWPLTLGAAVVAYRALGSTIVGQYVVVRSGLVTRATSVLARPAVSTIAIRESVFQKRLGLRTVSALTAAGDGIYEAPDLDARESVRFAAAAAPGLLDAFLVEDSDLAEDAGPQVR